MKPRLLFLSIICLLLYGWYCLNSDEYIKVLNRAMKHSSGEHAPSMSARSGKASKEDSTGPSVSIAGPNIR